MVSITTARPSFASSSFSLTFDQLSQEFRVSTEVATLALSLYVLGFAFDPLVGILRYSPALFRIGEVEDLLT